MNKTPLIARPALILASLLLFAALLSPGRANDKGGAPYGVDFGQAASYFEDKSLRDENGNRIVFNSMVDAMNYMGRDGWEFVQAYVVTVGQQNVYHWLLKKSEKRIDKQ